jgi:hypothetical protein
MNEVDLVTTPKTVLLKVTPTQKQYPAALRHKPTPLSLRDYSTLLLKTISLLHLSLLLPYNPFLQHLRLPIAKERDDHLLPCLMSSKSSFLHYFFALRAPILQLSDPAFPTIVLEHLVQHDGVELLRIFLEER